MSNFIFIIILTVFFKDCLGPPPTQFESIERAAELREEAQKEWLERQKEAKARSEYIRKKYNI